MDLSKRVDRLGNAAAGHQRSAARASRLTRRVTGDPSLRALWQTEDRIHYARARRVYGNYLAAFAETTQSPQ